MLTGAYLSAIYLGDVDILRKNIGICISLLFSFYKALFDWVFYFYFTYNSCEISLKERVFKMLFYEDETENLSNALECQSCCYERALCLQEGKCLMYLQEEYTKSPVNKNSRPK